MNKTSAVAPNIKLMNTKNRPQLLFQDSSSTQVLGMQQHIPVIKTVKNSESR